MQYLTALLGQVEDAILDSPGHVANHEPTVIAEAAEGPGVRG